MLAILTFLNAHNLPMFQPILMILVSKLMVHRGLSDKTFLSLGLLSPLNLICKMIMFWKSCILTFWPHSLSSPRGLCTGFRSKITFDTFLIYCNAVCIRNFCKNIDIWLSYCEIYILDLWPHRGGGGDGTFLIMVMLIYRHWVIMAYSDTL